MAVAVSTEGSCTAMYGSDRNGFNSKLGDTNTSGIWAILDNRKKLGEKKRDARLD